MRRVLLFFIMVRCFLFVTLACAEDFVTNNSNGNVLQRWTDAQMVWSTAENVSGVTLLDIGPDGNVYGSTSLGDNARVWNGGTGAYLGTVIVEGNIALGYEINRVYGIKFGPDVDGDGIEDLYSFEGGDATSNFVHSWTSSSGYLQPGSYTVENICTAFGAWDGDFGPDVSGDGRPDLFIMDGTDTGSGNICTVVDGVTADLLYTFPMAELRRPGNLKVGTDGRIYVTSRNTNKIFSYLPDGSDVQEVVGSEGSNFSTQIDEGTPGEWYISNRFNVTGLPTDAGSVVVSTDNLATTSILIAGTEAADLYNCIASFDGGVAVLPNQDGFSNLTADIDDDGVVNLDDLAEVGIWWASNQCDGSSHCMGADIDTDDTVDFKDFKYVAAQWLQKLSEPRTVEVDVQADTYLASGSSAATNFGSSVTLKTLNSDALEYQTLLRYDLPKIGIAPDSAFVWIHTLSTQTDPVENTAYLVIDDSWLEHNVTWNTKPDAAQELDAWVTNNDRAIKIDVTDQVTETLQGDGRLSIMIRSPHNIGSDGQSLYYSKEDSSGLAPTLVMSFNQPKAYVQPGQSIQQAIDTVHSQDGGQVVLLSGEHFIDTSLTLYSDITLRGQGKGNTSILMSQASNEPLCVGTSEGTVNSDITIADLTLNALLEPDEQHYPSSYHSDPPPDLDIRKEVIGVLFTDQDSGNTFERIRFENIGVTRCSMGIHVKGVDDLRILNSDISGNGSIIGYYHNIYFRRANNTLLKDLNLSNCTAGNGFNLSTNCNNLILDNCDASDNIFRGIRFEANDGGSRQMVVNCTADRNGLTEGQPGMRIANVPDFTILGCTANGNGDNGFYCVGSSDGLIKGNTAINNADNDYYLQNCNTIEVINNIGGTYLAAGGSNIITTGNDFD